MGGTDSCWIDHGRERQTCVHGRCVSSDDGTDASRCVCDPGYSGHLCADSKLSVSPFLGSRWIFNFQTNPQTSTTAQTTRAPTEPLASTASSRSTASAPKDSTDPRAPATWTTAPEIRADPTGPASIWWRIFSANAATDGRAALAATPSRTAATSRASTAPLASRTRPSSPADARPDGADPFVTCRSTCRAIRTRAATAPLASTRASRSPASAATVTRASTANWMPPPARRLRRRRRATGPAVFIRTGRRGTRAATNANAETDARPAPGSGAVRPIAWKIRPGSALPTRSACPSTSRAA